MRPSRNAKKIWGTTFILLLLGTAVYQLGMHPVIRCYLVKWSGLDQIAPNLYVSPDMPQSQRYVILLNEC
jgi:hypothetical protein